MKKNKEVRTCEMIDQEYTNLAALAGHKASQIGGFAEEITRLENEVKAHHARMKELGLEARKLKAAQAPDALSQITNPRAE
jgi:thiaminase